MPFSLEGNEAGGPVRGRAIVLHESSTRRIRGGGEQQRRGPVAPANGAGAPRGPVRGRGLVDRRHARDDGGRGARPIGVTSGFRVRSKVRPWEGTFADVDRAARSLAGALQAGGSDPATSSLFQIPNWVEAGITFWAAAYLGAVVVPVVHFYGAKEVDYILRATSPDVIVTADQFGHNDFVATYDALLADRPEPLWLVTTGPAGSPLPDRATRFESLLDHEPDRRPAAGRSRRAGRHRVHLGHDARPEGRRPLAPHDRVRDPPARVRVPHGRAAADHRRAGGSLHRHAQRLPRPAAAGAGGQPDRRVGPGRGAADDDRGGARRVRAAPPTSSPACSTTPTSPPSTWR